METGTPRLGRNLLQGECTGAGRRAGFEGIAGLAAIAPEMAQNALHNPGLGNDGNDLHLGAPRAQEMPGPILRRRFGDEAAGGILGREAGLGNGVTGEDRLADAGHGG